MNSKLSLSAHHVDCFLWVPGLFRSRRYVSWGFRQKELFGYSWWKLFWRLRHQHHSYMERIQIINTKFKRHLLYPWNFKKHRTRSQTPLHFLPLRTQSITNFLVLTLGYFLDFLHLLFVFSQLYLFLFKFLIVCWIMLLLPQFLFLNRSLYPIINVCMIPYMKFLNLHQLN